MSVAKKLGGGADPQHPPPTSDATCLWSLCYERLKVNDIFLAKNAIHTIPTSTIV